eukprot:TRINITY_DN1087_c0_g1_i1.p1 TRINITY_DN1087_c0_g1~~TRINITY_DN1087_c0_g1_i1.p1  ORF type:complete len:154 (+),score=50.84 TRINITY_DN1087_c0_g1_i1:157-618(+)
MCIRDSSQGVSPQDLSLEQLSQVKKQLEQEVQQLQANLQTFKSVIGKCEESKESLEAIVPDNAGKQMLIPLTGSLYVPGKLGSNNKVLVDIGTGYYVRKTGDQAREFFGRKLDMVNQNVEALQRIVSEKQKNLESVNIIMSNKMRTEDKVGGK